MGSAYPDSPVHPCSRVGAKEGRKMGNLCALGSAERGARSAERGTKSRWRKGTWFTGHSYKLSGVRGGSSSCGVTHAKVGRLGSKWVEMAQNALGHLGPPWAILGFTRRFRPFSRVVLTTADFPRGKLRTASDDAPRQGRSVCFTLSRSVPRSIRKSKLAKGGRGRGFAMPQFSSLWCRTGASHPNASAPATQTHLRSGSRGCPDNRQNPFNSTAPECR